MQRCLAWGEGCVTQVCHRVLLAPKWRQRGKQVVLWGLYYGMSSDQSHWVIRIFLSLCSHIPLSLLLKMMTIIDLLREAERSPLPLRGQRRGQKLPTPLARTENLSTEDCLLLHSHDPLNQIIYITEQLWGHHIQSLFSYNVGLFFSWGR